MRVFACHNALKQTKTYDVVMLANTTSGSYQK